MMARLLASLQDISIHVVRCVTKQGTLLLSYNNLNKHIITSPVKCEIKFPIHFQTLQCIFGEHGPIFHVVYQVTWTKFQLMRKGQ